MGFPESTEKNHYEHRFMMALKYRGQRCNSIDDLLDKLKQDYSGFLITDCVLTPQRNDEFDSVSEPFGYVTAQIGVKELQNLEYLGFKLDSEPFIRLGPPHLEPSRERVCFGDVDGYKLYESPAKQHELLSHRSL